MLNRFYIWWDRLVEYFYPVTSFKMGKLEADSAYYIGQIKRMSNADVAMIDNYEEYGRPSERPRYTAKKNTTGEGALEFLRETLSDWIPVRTLETIPFNAIHREQAGISRVILHTAGKLRIGDLTHKIVIGIKEKK